MMCGGWAAAAPIHALMSPEVYRLLVDGRAWSPERYEQWLADILIGQLLAPAASPDVHAAQAGQSPAP